MGSAQCLDRRRQFADAVGRSANLDLYVDLLAEHEAWLACSATFEPGPLLRAAQAIDAALPGM